MNSKQGLGALLAPYATNRTAEAIGVSTATVTNWRSGRTTPDRQHWGRLCEFTGLRMHELISCIQADDQTGKASDIGRRVQRLGTADRRTVLMLLAHLESKSNGGAANESHPS